MVVGETNLTLMKGLNVSSCPMLEGTVGIFFSLRLFRKNNTDFRETIEMCLSP